MKKYWVVLVTGENGYLWAEERPMFASFATVSVEMPDGSLKKVYGQIYRVE